MSRLSGSDYRGVLNVLREAGDVEGPLPFPEPVLDALRRLVPCDVVSYHERLGSTDVIVFAGEPRAEVTRQVREAERRYFAQDVLAPCDGARLYSDFFSPREFHRLGIYQEVARPMGVEDMVAPVARSSRRAGRPAGVRPSRLAFS